MLYSYIMTNLSKYKWYRHFKGGVWAKYWVNLPSCYFYIYRHYEDEFEYDISEKYSQEELIDIEYYTKYSKRRKQIAKIIKELKENES